MIVCRWILGALFLLITSYSAALAVDAAPSKTAQTLQEAHLWQLASKEQGEREQRFVVFHDDYLDAYLQKIVARLWSYVRTDLPPLSVRVLQDTALDAYAYPNGVCYVTTGMLAHVQNEDQLAMVLAHEMIHYIRRHSLAAFGHHQRRGAQRVDGQMPNADRRRKIMTALCDAAERQADQEGLALMQAAGYCPHEVLRLVAGLQTQNDDQSAKASSLIRQPTADERRMEQVRVLLAGIQDDGGCAQPDGWHAVYLNNVAPALLVNAKRYVRQGRWDGAQETIRRYLAVKANDPQAYYLRGEIERQRLADNEEQAAAFYQKAIDMNHAFAPAYRALGVIHFKAGRTQVARRYFETGLALAPQAQENEYIRGYLHLCPN